MIVYSVRWDKDDSLKTSSRGRPKNGEYYIMFTVLCNKISEAFKCLEFVFSKTYTSKGSSLSLNDGMTTIVRSSVDSRSINIGYLYTDDMIQPLKLSSLGSSLMDYCNRNTLHVYR